jgi:hypothetical protein
MSLTWRRSRITGAGLVAAQYDLTLERQTIMDNVLFIPGIANPVSEINQLLFGQGQPGGGWVPSFSPTMIAANSFGSGVTDILDLSGNNNPFSQATPSSRGAWFREPKTGRRNLVTQTESIDNAVWIKDQLVTTGSPQWIFPGQGPNGQTAFKLILNNGVETAGANSSGLRIIEAVTSGIYRVSFFAKAAEVSSLRIRENVSLGTFLVINLANGTITGGGGPGSQFVDPLVTDEGSGWYRISFTTATMSNFNKYAYRQNANGDGTSGVLFTMPQYELRNAATPTAYQRVTTAFDVTEAGQRDCFGVRFDGTDDWYERAINFSGTDKVTLFVAMRRRSDAARGTVLELTSSIDSNNGAFHLTAPNAASATFGFESKGTTLRDAVITQAMGNPRIITAIGDISGDLASIQVDNGTPTTNTGDQGSGNYANSTLYLGRRGGSSLSLNGDIFGVIAAGGEYTAATRQRVRTILSRITPTVNL